MTKLKKEKWGRIHQTTGEEEENDLDDSEHLNEDQRVMKMTKSSRILGVNPTEVLKEIFGKGKGTMKSSIFGGFESRRRGPDGHREVKSARVLGGRRRGDLKSRGRKGSKKSPFEQLTQKYGHLPIFGGQNKKSRGAFKRKNSKKNEKKEKIGSLRETSNNIFEQKGKKNIEEKVEVEVDEKMMKSPLKENLIKTCESPIFYISSQKEKHKLSNSRPSIRSSRLKNPPRPSTNPKTERPKQASRRENSRKSVTSREKTIYEKVLQNSKSQKYPKKNNSSRKSLRKTQNGGQSSIYGDVEFRRRKARQQSLRYQKKKRRKVSKKKVKKGAEKSNLEEKLKKLNLKVERMAQRNKGFLQEYDWDQEFDLNLGLSLRQKSKGSFKKSKKKLSTKKSSQKKKKEKMKNGRINSEKKRMVNPLNTIFSSHMTKSAKSKVYEQAFTPTKKSHIDFNFGSSSQMLKISSILTPKSDNSHPYTKFSHKKRSNFLPLKPYGNTPVTPGKECIFTIPDTQTKIENYPEFKFLIKKISPLSQEKSGLVDTKSQNRMDQKLKKILPHYKRPENYGREEISDFQNQVIKDLKSVLAREQNMRLEKERQMLMMLVEDQKKVEFLEKNLDEVFPKTGRSLSRGKIRSTSAKKSPNEEMVLKIGKESSKKKKLFSNREFRSSYKRRTKKSTSTKKRKKVKKKKIEDVSKMINFDEEAELDKENFNRGDEQYRRGKSKGKKDEKKLIEEKRRFEDFNFLYEDEDAYEPDSSFEREIRLKMIKDKYKKMIEIEKQQAENV